MKVLLALCILLGLPVGMMANSIDKDPWMRFEGHFRQYSMATFNRGELPDYAGAAFGAGTKLTTKQIYGFQIRASAFFVGRMASNDLLAREPKSGVGVRYESTLFDMNDLENKDVMTRLEELQIQYQYRNHVLRIGRQVIQSPLLNAQDNRMRGNYFEALTYHHEGRLGQWQGGLVWRVSPRGTLSWYRMGASLGVYPPGANPSGVQKSYKNQLKSRYVAFAGWQGQRKGYKGELWYFQAHQLFHLAYFRIRSDWKQFWIGSEGLFQGADAMRSDTARQALFILPNEKAWMIGFAGGFQRQNLSIQIHGLITGKSGRWLFPREWGREIFFANLSRERFEGFAGVRAFGSQLQYQIYKGFKIISGVNYVLQPDASDFRRNKYGLDDYMHYVMEWQYQWKREKHDVRIRALGVYKQNIARYALPPQYLMNRSDMGHVALILDYYF